MVSLSVTSCPMITFTESLKYLHDHSIQLTSLCLLYMGIRKMRPSSNSSRRLISRILVSATNGLRIETGLPTIAEKSTAKKLLIFSLQYVINPRWSNEIANTFPFLITPLTKISFWGDLIKKGNVLAISFDQRG